MLIPEIAINPLAEKIINAFILADRCVCVRACVCVWCVCVCVCVVCVCLVIFQLMNI